MKTKAIIVALAVGVLALISFIWVPVPSGWIPERPPSEDRRVVHPLGFSVVKPPGWFEKVFRDGDNNFNGDEIYLLPTTNKVRFCPCFRVSTFTNAPAYLSNYSETRFLDMVAYEKKLLRAGNGDFFTYDLYITSHDRWYRLLYQIPADTHSPSITTVPATMLPYIQSFKPMP